MEPEPSPKTLGAWAVLIGANTGAAIPINAGAAIPVQIPILATQDNPDNIDGGVGAIQGGKVTGADIDDNGDGGDAIGNVQAARADAGGVDNNSRNDVRATVDGTATTGNVRNSSNNTDTATAGGNIAHNSSNNNTVNNNGNGSSNSVGNDD